MESTITAKQLFDLVESLFSKFKVKHTIHKIIDSKEHQIFRISQGENSYEVSKLCIIQNSIYGYSIYRYSPLDSKNNCKPIAVSYNDLTL